MTTPSALLALEYAPETSFAESSTTYGTLRVPIIAPIDPSGLVQEKQESGVATQQINGGSPFVLMGKSGTFKIKFDLPGHGSTMVGSPTKSLMEALIGYFIGNSALSASASTTLTGGTAAVPLTTASGTVSAGGIVGIGSLGDAKGSGQMYPVSTHSGTSLNLLVDMDAAGANGNVLYPTTMMYFHETAFGPGLTSTVPGLRFRFVSANLQYACRGCFPTAISVTGFNTGERPQMEVTLETADWDAVTSGTFPSTLATEQNNPAPIAAGSLNVQTVGTTTRNKVVYRDFKIDISLGMTKQTGPGGVGQYQVVTSCTRMPTKIKVSWVQDADAAATATPVAQGLGTSTNSKHIMWTGSTADGSAIGAYMPNVRISNVPVQFNDGGINRMRVEGEAHAGTTTTNDLTASALRLAFR